MISGQRLIIIGAKGGSHIGDSLFRAARQLSIETEFCDVKDGWKPSSIGHRLMWHFGGRRPVALNRFSRNVVERCRRFRPTTVVATGTAPVSAHAIADCRSSGVKCLNFLTDDPFNRQHRSRWFLRALREYNVVFTPRRANIEDLKAHGCRRVEYLPFGYDPELFYPEEFSSDEKSELFFAGTGDPDRFPYITAAVKAGIRVRLHGSYWEKNRVCRTITRGQADVPALRRGISSCGVALGLVREANRDGHSMRTFEVPAVGACMVVQDTVEHRALFGGDEERVAYFREPAEMVDKVVQLLKSPSERRRLRMAAHSHIVNGKNTYADRLSVMVESSRSRYLTASMQ